MDRRTVLSSGMVGGLAALAVESLRKVVKPDRVFSGSLSIHTNGGRVGVTSAAEPLTESLATLHVVNEDAVSCGLRVQAHWAGSAQAPFQNHDASLYEVFNTVQSDSLNRSWAGSFSNNFNNIPPGVTDSGTRVGVIGWAGSVYKEGYRHEGALNEQVGVVGTAGFQGSGSGSSAVVAEAVGVRGTIYGDTEGATISAAYGGQFVTRASVSSIGLNIAVYASAANGTENYSFYGRDGALYQRETSFFEGQVSFGDRPVLPSNPPTSPKEPGAPGEVSWDAGYVYVCVAPNTWKRAALSSW